VTTAQNRMTLEAVVYGGPSPTGPVDPGLGTVPAHRDRGLPAAPRASRSFTSLPGMLDDSFARCRGWLPCRKETPFYKIELRASYPAPDTSGGVGGKVTGIYFTTSG
jgi:hypothetical protein